MFLLTLTLIGAGLLYAFDAHTIIKEAVVTRYRKFRSLNKLVNTQYKSIFKILYVSICMICKMYWMNILQWSNKTVKRIDKNTVTVSYVLRGKLYTFVVKEKRGPRNIIAISDENDEDVSLEVLPFLGPSEDVHAISITPSLFRKESLTLITVDGNEMTYTSTQVIKTKRSEVCETNMTIVTRTSPEMRNDITEKMGGVIDEPVIDEPVIDEPVIKGRESNTRVD